MMTTPSTTSRPRNIWPGGISRLLTQTFTRTNGYHPIWLLLITPVYWIFDSESALFAIKTLEIMLCAGGAALIVFAARLSLPAPRSLLCSVVCLGAGPYKAGDERGRLGLFYGMEGAASLFWLGLLFLACSLFEKNPSRWTWFPTVVVFTLPWVRLEFALSRSRSLLPCASSSGRTP